MLSYLLKHYDKLLLYLLQHLEIVAASLGLAVIFAVPVGLALSRSKLASTAVLGIFSVLYSIPSLALFSFFLPITGLGMKTAVIVVAIYAQFILLRNTVAGFQSVDASVLESGNGMGLSALQRFYYIELPLALPVVIAGVRIALVASIGIATIAATVNGGGIGTLLFEGLRNMYPVKIFWGIILSSGLSFGANQALIKLENHLLKRAKGEWVGPKSRRREISLDSSGL